MRGAVPEEPEIRRHAPDAAVGLQQIEAPDEAPDVAVPAARITADHRLALVVLDSDPDETDVVAAWTHDRHVSPIALPPHVFVQEEIP